MLRYSILILASIIILLSCTPRLIEFKKNPIIPIVNSASNSDKKESYKVSLDRDSNTLKSIIYIDSTGKELEFSQAIYEDGQVGALRQLNSITVTAKTNKIAERNGKINIDFVITIPKGLHDSSWEIITTPQLTLNNRDTLNFDMLIFSGVEFKKEQEKGYRRYERYLKSIIPDDVNFLEVFTDLPNLMIFLDRHLPESDVVNGTVNNELSTKWGVREQQIVDHYIKRWLVNRNKKRKENQDKVFARYVKNPYINGSVRLDSIVTKQSGDIDYYYTQDIKANEHTSKLFLNLKTHIRDINGLRAHLPLSDTVTYNVSSLTHFISQAPVYKKVIVERAVKHTKDMRFNFAVNCHKINPDLGDNKQELNNLNSLIEQLFENDRFILDSVVITAASSIDGPFRTNERLSQNRANEFKEYYLNYLSSLEKDLMIITHGSDNHTERKKMPKIVSKSLAEDWESLYMYLKSDTTTNTQVDITALDNISDKDNREKALKRLPEYEYIKVNILPLLRRVTFQFNLSRKDMVKDTIHTTELDTLYMRGVELLSHKKYAMAIDILRGYNTINTAIAHMSLGNDASASAILDNLEQDAYYYYLKAILYQRKRDEENAVLHFLKAKELDRRMAYRGYLDIEINELIEKYNLNKDLFD